jgi:tRNA A-37 threonylcarbamoyl transferase component Bud32
MGIVYKARQISLKRIVALKMIRAGQLASPEDVRRFRIEAENAATLDHPNIVPIYEVGEREGQHYFTMKRIAGGSLAQNLGLFAHSSRAGARLVAKVARAVHHAHQRGILHRDLKPPNILLDARGRPHVTDFGLAKRVEGDAGMTQTGVAVGTPSYMAPEQAAGKKHLTTAVDVYGLGTILYELLTGRPPFWAPTVVETLRLVLEQEPARPRTFNPRLDRDLETICLKCLQKDPGQRYTSAEALAEDLDYWLAGEPIEGRRTSIAGRAIKWTRRNRLVATLLALSTLALLGMVGLMGVLWVNAEKRAKAVHEREIAQTQLLEAEREAEIAQKRLAEVQDQHKTLVTKPGAGGGESPILKGGLPAAIFSKESGFVYTVAISPDGKQIAFSVEGKPVGIWDISARREILAFRADSWIVASVAYSHDGKYLATGGTDGILRVWPAKDGVNPRTLPGHTKGILSVVFSPDDKLLATASWDRTVRLWDAVAGKVIWFTKEQGDSVRTVAFRPDGKRLVSVAGGTAKVWEVDALGQVLTLKSSGGSAFYRSALFSADGLQLICAADNKVSVYNANTGKESKSLEGIHCPIALSADGKILAGAYVHDTVKLVDTTTWKDIAILQKDTSSIVHALAFSRSGKLLASAEGVSGKVLLWDLEEARQRATTKGADE